MDENEIRTEKDAVENMFDSLNECNLCGCIIKKNVKLQYYCAGCDVSKQKIILKQEEINTDKSKARYFETDLLVYEEVENDYIPRVVIEVKHRTFTTHDVITYTEKAKKHKLLYPYIQY
ncbi:MAG: hypothetical protein LUB59_07360, partial [Candidatus Gastranaerophilales bacterium]|nr:hypothetical protein [Candidatus Gastranaerophilales bacterium]